MVATMVPLLLLQILVLLAPQQVLQGQLLFWYRKCCSCLLRLTHTQLLC